MPEAGIMPFRMPGGADGNDQAMIAIKWKSTKSFTQIGALEDLGSPTTTALDFFATPVFYRTSAPFVHHETILFFTV